MAHNGEMIALGKLVALQHVHGWLKLHVLPKLAADRLSMEGGEEGHGARQCDHEWVDPSNEAVEAGGHIVISVGMCGHADQPTGARFLTSDGDESAPEKQRLDQLHFRKIDLADEIVVINVGGYVGASTRREIGYAEKHGKAVRWLFPDARPALEAVA